tara:strand:- start:515 stop:991 length:477 start_codon:yes stop_codon:yes gene_type:complete
MPYPVYIRDILDPSSKQPVFSSVLKTMAEFGYNVSPFLLINVQPGQTLIPDPVVITMTPDPDQPRDGTKKMVQVGNPLRLARTAARNVLNRIWQQIELQYHTDARNGVPWHQHVGGRPRIVKKTDPANNTYYVEIGERGQFKRVAGAHCTAELTLMLP